MPISGVVVSSLPNDVEEVAAYLETFAEIEVHDSDAAGNIVAVLETLTSEAMQDLIDLLARDARIITVGLTYLNTEDEVRRALTGGDVPRPHGFRGDGRK